MVTLFYIHEEAYFQNPEAPVRVRAVVEACLDCGPINGIFRDGRLVRLDDPDDLLRAGLESEEIVDLANGIEGRWVTLVYQRLSPEFNDPPIKLMIVDGSPEPVAHTPALFAALAPLSHALYGRAWAASPNWDFAERYLKDEEGYPRQPLDKPNLPFGLGWLNYWSDAAITALGATGIDLVAQGLAAHCAPCTGGQGGLVWRVTDDILDVNRPEHDARVQAIFSTFPALRGVPYEREPMPEGWLDEIVAEHEARVASGYYARRNFDDTDDLE